MKPNNVSAEIIAVGSELLLGQIVNTNAAYISTKLSEIGIDLFRQSVVGDNPERLTVALKDALSKSDIVITSGGLGPTVDDITMAAIASTVSRPLILDEEIWKSIKDFFKKRRLKMPHYVSKQAHVLEGALAIKNPVGTAPGVIIEYGKKTIIALPGPPRELKPILEKSVIPYLRKKFGKRSIILTRSIRTAGLPESYVNKKISKFLMMSGQVTAGIYSRPNEVDIKITAKAVDKKRATAKIKKVEKNILSILGKAVFGFDGDTLELIVGKELTKKHMTLSIAESCTGGLISSRITNISGSSKYLDRSIITYSDRSKIKELGVKKDLIARHGAVSRPVAVAMAKGIRGRSGSDVALAVTGIAGPSGGTEEKPVGLVYIALAKQGNVRCVERRYIGNRTDIKYQVSSAALELLRKELLK